MSTVTKAGLEDIVVSTSDICFIDGREGRLLYRGFDVDDLVAHSTFEEVTYLLWYGGLPSRKELETHVKALSASANRKLPPPLVTMLRALPRKTSPERLATFRSPACRAAAKTTSRCCATRAPCATLRRKASRCAIYIVWQMNSRYSYGA